MHETYEFFAPCPRGLGGVAAEEIRSFGIKVRPLQTGVCFFGSIPDAYRVCLFSRTASRVLMVLARVDAKTADELYTGAYAIPWEDHIAEGRTIALDASGTNDALRNTQFVALRVKDAICDRLRRKTGVRPDVDKHHPDVPLTVALKGTRATISLNLSGPSLHRRGYREQGVQVEAPLKEALAAGMLLIAGWDTCAAQGGAFLDPMCGSGTLALEAAMIAVDMAPGIMRSEWGFLGWRQHDEEAWADLLGEADDRLEAGLERFRAQDGSDGEAPAECSGGHPAACAGRMAAEDGEGARAAIDEEGRVVDDGDVEGALSEKRRAGDSERAKRGPRICASDHDPRAIELARTHAKRLGLADIISFTCIDVADIGEAPGERGLIATNPPYGERISTATQLPALYASLGAVLRRRFPGWKAAIITPDETIDLHLGYQAYETHALYNGRIPAALRLYDLSSGFEQQPECAITIGERAVSVLEKNSDQYANRLKKRFSQMRKWARRNDIHCYRIYDADLPDYNVAVDIYEGAGPDEGVSRVVVFEYAAPADVDAARSRRRLADVLAITPLVLGVEVEDVFFKVRHRQRPEQVEKDRHAGVTCITEEHGHLFEVNLSDYLDTGIFLDHRLVRKMLEDMVRVSAQGEGSGEGGVHRPRFLNLFAYTGTATVHAAAGGAYQTTTVDMSQTYLDWAQRNMRRNGFIGPSHEYIRADCVAWVTETRRTKLRWDLIFIDPPTYSNSKQMGCRDWDVQRDHAELLIGVSRLLTRQGQAIFSCNLRDFKPDHEKLARAGVRLEDMTAQTIDEDFARNPKIHHCYRVSRV